MTGWNIPTAALGEDEGDLEAVEEDPEPVVAVVAVDPDLPVVWVLLTVPVVTVLFLPPEGTMTLEAAEEGYGTATRVVEFEPAGTVAAD